MPQPRANYSDLPDCGHEAHTCNTDHLIRGQLASFPIVAPWHFGVSPDSVAVANPLSAPHDFTMAMVVRHLGGRAGRRGGRCDDRERARTVRTAHPVAAPKLPSR